MAGSSRRSRRSYGLFACEDRFFIWYRLHFWAFSFRFFSCVPTATTQVSLHSMSDVNISSLCRRYSWPKYTRERVVLVIFLPSSSLNTPLCLLPWLPWQLTLSYSSSNEASKKWRAADRCYHLTWGTRISILSNNFACNTMTYLAFCHVTRSIDTKEEVKTKYHNEIHTEYGQYIHYNLVMRRE